MSYFCRDCKFKTNGALSNPPRCPDCGSIYLLQDESKLRKFNNEVRRLARLRKNKKEPITFYDRLFSAVFVMFITAVTLIVGPVALMFSGGGHSGFEMIIQEYKFIFTWWPSLLFGAAIIGFIFDIDRISNFFGYIWGTVKHNEEVSAVLVLFVIGAVIFAFIFQMN